jgi:hypothetical protein
MRAIAPPALIMIKTSIDILKYYPKKKSRPISRKVLSLVQYRLRVMNVPDLVD